MQQIAPEPKCRPDLWEIPRNLWNNKIHNGDHKTCHWSLSWAGPLASIKEMYLIILAVPVAVRTKAYVCGGLSCVIYKPREWGGPGPLGAVAPKTKQKKLLYYLHLFLNWAEQWLLLSFTNVNYRPLRRFLLQVPAKTSPKTKCSPVIYFGFPPRRKWDLQSYDFRQGRLIVSHRRFGQPICSIFKGYAVKHSAWTAWTFMMEQIGCPETSVTTNLRCVTSQKSEDIR